MNQVLNSHKSDEWETPPEIYNIYKKLGYFDPCPIERKWNGLEIEWKPKNFVNPPYSQLKNWIKKGIEENQKGKEVVFLIPARPSTKWFNDLYDYGSIFVFLRKRLKFSNKANAPFPSMLVIPTGRKSKMILEEKHGTL